MAVAARTPLATLVGHLPGERLVWGGDWNHALAGPEYAGSAGGRRALLAALETTGLDAVTGDLAHRLQGLLTIDHVAVPTGTRAHVVRVDATGHSDHDAYVVDAAL